VQTDLHHRHKSVVIHARDFWFARGAVVVVAALQLLLVNDFSLGARWVAPVIELLLLLPLSVATAWVHIQVKTATTEGHFYLAARWRRWIRRAAIVLTALITAMNFVALFFLVRALLGGHAGNARSLLVDAVNIWCTNVVAFTLWYWSIDRGGPAARGLSDHTMPDFLFPQMTMDDPRLADWSPGFVDYLFLSFTNAFSPTDSPPLSPRAKLLMMANAGVSLLTLALVAARAVNILA
jgi:hypothetical protein